MEAQPSEASRRRARTHRPDRYRQPLAAPSGWGGRGLHFTRNPQVTFTNNEAEREVRMPKVKLKVAGCFRTPSGVQAFCITRSYLSTLKKQGRELLPSLEATFNGDDPLMGLTSEYSNNRP